jgi:hypothetical protein
MNWPMVRRLIAVLPLTIAACGGSSSPAAPSVNASGSYTGGVTDQMDSCPMGAKPGGATNVQITVTQTDTGNITLQVDGAWGLVLGLGLGTRTISGTISGNHIEAVLVGTINVTEAGCTHKWQGNLSADVNGNVISGQMVYTPQSMTGDCAAFMTCQRVQTFTISK